MKTLKGSCVSFKTMKWIRKRLDESNCNYKDTASRKKTHSDRSDRKNTECVGAIQAIFDNDHPNSNSIINRDIEMFVFLIW